ncbi:MAG TPA: zinc ribbon domain-containing protein [bacterium]|jgi:uncharacterized membrane protein YvbJ|nr:zinc ribbon domain-containing protein [bacterium]
MIRCPNCGTENPAGKIVCRNCGHRLRGGAQTARATHETEADLMFRVRYDVRRIVYVGASVVAVGLALGYLMR